MEMLMSECYEEKKQDKNLHDPRKTLIQVFKKTHEDIC